MSRRTLLVFLALFLPVSAHAQDPDPGSLRVVKETGSSVSLSWTSPAPTSYCVKRDAASAPTTPIAQVRGLTHVDDPPAASLWCYDVSAAPPDGCFGGGGEPQCMSLGPVICGALRQDNNSNSGVSAMAAYPCTAFEETGPEYLYDFIAAQDGDMTVTLTGLSAELDIVVLEDVLGCQADSCIAFGDSTTTFPITAGTRYFVAIEGRDGAVGTYTVTFACNLPPQDCVPASNLDCASAAFSNNGAVGSTDAIDQYPGCIDWDESGREIVYQWIAPDDVTALASLSDLTDDLDVFVLEENGQGCSVADCIAYGDDAATFDAVAGRLYFLVVDGRAGALGDFRLYLDCFPAPGTCRSLQSLACGASVSGSNDQSGSRDAVDQWTGCTPFMEDGPEVAYEFVASATGLVDATLSGLSAELDLFVLRDDGAGCTSATCFGAGDTAVSFAAEAGQRYFLVVDGRDGAIGSFTLAVTCR